MVPLDRKTRLELEAREEEWSIASGLRRSVEQAADWAVARELNRALNKPGERRPGCSPC